MFVWASMEILISCSLSEVTFFGITFFGKVKQQTLEIILKHMKDRKVTSSHHHGFVTFSVGATAFYK